MASLHTQAERITQTPKAERSIAQWLTLSNLYREMGVIEASQRGCEPGVFGGHRGGCYCAVIRNKELEALVNC